MVTVRWSNHTLAVVVAGLALLVGGCSGSTTPGTSTTGAETAASSPTTASTFPVTIEHQFGTTVIPAAPTRVVTIGFNEQDFVLSFEVEPVGVREFLGYDAPNRPWVPESVRGKAIPTVGSSELELEKIAALQPDLIMGIHSYMDQAMYAKLAGIAPTVAQSGDVAIGATTWQDQTLVTGRALGQETAARGLVDRTEQLFVDAKAANPSFTGPSAMFVLGGSTADGINSLGADDYRTGWLAELGFTVPAEGQRVSFERLDLLDADVDPATVPEPYGD